jgi:hypothetical protein
VTGKITHVGFADESNWNTGRFRSLGLVTTSTGSLTHLDNKLRAVLDESNVSEFKWNDLGGARERFAAEKLCCFVADKACNACLRIDVLVWDIEDSRHIVANRDDMANLERMYYHLFRNVMRARWPNDALWRLHPDEHTGLDWRTMQSCLAAKGTLLKADRSLLTGGEVAHEWRREFGIEEIQPVSSANQPLIQLADLFSGLAVFSRAKYGEYEQWEEDTSPQGKLFEYGKPAEKASARSEERFAVLAHFDHRCKAHKLGVSLKSCRGLRTLDGKNPINFWWYEPQHPEDKAPQKGERLV